MLIPPTSSTGVVGSEVGPSASSPFSAASISSRRQVTGATAWSAVPVGSGGYFGDERSATTRLYINMKTVSRTS